MPATTLTTSLDVNALAALCGQDAADLLLARSMEQPAPHAPSDLVESRLHLPAGVASIELGHASDGQPIVGYRWGSEGPSVLVYGWTHPDEPAGALASRWLIEHADHPALANVRWLVIPCADPQVAAMSERWARGSTLADYVYGSVRPEHLQREVDYGFPISGSTLVMPPWRDAGRACASAGRCVQADVCGEVCQRLRSVPGPLPESMALARAVDIAAPDLAVALHNSAAGGVYGFWQHRPDAEMLDACAYVAGACTLPRHLGVPIDRGRAWERRWPDARREQTLDDAETAFRRRHRLDPDDHRRFLAHGSFAQYLSMRYPEAQCLMPEAGLFTHPDFGNKAPTGEFRCLVERSDGEVVERGASFTLPWGEEHWAVYARWKDEQATAREEEVELALSVGQLTVEAVLLRRALLEAADALWDALPEAVREGDDIQAAERRQLRMPAAVARQRTLAWARTLRAQRPATRAQAADYRWRWALESCVMAGRIHSLAARSGYGGLEAAAALAEHIDATLASLPLREVRVEAAVSQLARMFAWLELGQ